MEIHIVFAHELVQMDVLGVEPPLLPLGREICGNADVAYRCIELQVIRECNIIQDRVGLPKHL